MNHTERCISSQQLKNWSRNSFMYYNVFLLIPHVNCTSLITFTINKQYFGKFCLLSNIIELNKYSLPTYNKTVYCKGAFKTAQYISWTDTLLLFLPPYSLYCASVLQYLRQIKCKLKASAYYVDWYWNTIHYQWPHIKIAHPYYQEIMLKEPWKQFWNSFYMGILPDKN